MKDVFSIEKSLICKIEEELDEDKKHGDYLIPTTPISCNCNKLLIFGKVNGQNGEVKKYKEGIYLRPLSWSVALQQINQCKNGNIKNFNITN